MFKTLSACSTTLLLLSLLALNGCTCGFDCSDGDDDGDGGDGSPEMASLNLSLSDSLPEELKKVVIVIDRVTLRRSDGDDVEIDSFAEAADPNDPDMRPAETITVDLLEYPGASQFPLITGLQIETGDYSDIVLDILTSDVNQSYVLDAMDRQFPLEVSNASLNLEGQRFVREEESYTIEFELARALDFEVSNNVYRLSNEGVRVVDEFDAATLSGQVDEELFDTVQECDDKIDSFVGNRVYLYQEHDLDSTALADVFNESSSEDVPEGAIAPYAVGTITEDPLTNSWRYFFGFLQPGDYTLAFTCNSENDDADDYDGISIPTAEDQVREVVLSNGDSEVCNFLEESTGC